MKYSRSEWIGYLQYNCGAFLEMISDAEVDYFIETAGLFGFKIQGDHSADAFRAFCYGLWVAERIRRSQVDEYYGDIEEG